MLQVASRKLCLRAKRVNYLVIAWTQQLVDQHWLGLSLFIAIALYTPFLLLIPLDIASAADQVQITTHQPDNLPPFVVSTAPAAGENRVSVTQPIHVVFSEAMDTATFNNTNIIVQAPRYNERITGTSVYENDAIRWMPNQYWQPFTTYQITLTSGIQDITGSPLMTYTWVFTTHFDSNLPIVVVDTFGQTVQDEPKIPAQMQIIWNSLFGRNFLDDLWTQPQNLHFDGNIGIEVRGNTSQAYPKKQYGFETRDTDNRDLAVSLLAFPSESDWILQGPYIDRSLMRNYLAYYLSNQIGRYAVRTHYVELFLNNINSPQIGVEQYMGVYLLMEKIKRDKNRVNVAKLTAEQNAEPEISGGYIIKQDVTDPGDVFFYTAIGNHQLTFVYPDESQLTELQKGWINNYFNQFESTLMKDDFTDRNSGYADYVDIGSFVDHLLLNEFLRNVDAFRISAYFYKDRQGKLMAGPLWDFNFSAGNMDLAGAWNPQGWQVHNPTGGMYPIPFWWTRLLEDNCFVQRLALRWSDLRAGPLHITPINTIIDNTADYLDEAQRRNFQRWNILGRKIYLEEFVGATYAEEIDYMKAWLATRAAWMDQNIQSISMRKSPQAPGLCVVPADRATVTAGGYATTLQVGLSNQPTTDVILSLASSNQQMATFIPDRVSFAPSAWDLPQTITVTISDTTAIADQAIVTYTAILDPADSVDMNYAALAPTIITVEAIIVDTPKLDYILYLPVAFE